MKRNIIYISSIFCFLLFMMLHIQTSNADYITDISICGQVTYANKLPCPEGGCELTGSNFCGTPCDGVQYWYWLGR